MSSDEKILQVMKGLNQAVAQRGWCLVEGEVGVGKTRATQDALRQMGWHAVWKGVADLGSEEVLRGLWTAPKELLVLDGLVDEWAPRADEQMLNPSWTALYAAMTVAMARAQHGLLTVICAVIHREGNDPPPELNEIPGCVVITLV